MNNLTTLEKTLLGDIFFSEYHDGANPVGNQIWVDCACENHGTSAGGIMASLVKKGLVETDGETCWITEAGGAAVTALKLS